MLIKKAVLLYNLLFFCHATKETKRLGFPYFYNKTTEKYLGVEQDLHDAPCDRLGLNLG